MEKEIILKRVAPMNCEWLLRPKVATSEFAETFEENLKYLASSKLPFLNTENFTEWQQKLSNFIETLQSSTPQMKKATQPTKM